MSREDQTLSDCIIVAVLNLLKKEVGEHERHISQYFYFFLTYCSFSHAEVSENPLPHVRLRKRAFSSQRSQLLKMRVPALFIALALGEGPALIGYRHHATDLSRLYSVVSVLVRCYDVSRHMAHCVKVATQPIIIVDEISALIFRKPNRLQIRSTSCLSRRQCTRKLSRLCLRIQSMFRFCAFDILRHFFRYLKKVISENAAAEDTLQLFQVRRLSDVLPTS